MKDLINLFLDFLREEQSWCPFCSGEYVHNDDCILDGLWFEKEL